MADAGKGTGADDATQFEAPKTLEDAVKLAATQHESITKLEKAIKEANEESKSRKEKLRAAEDKAAKDEQSRLEKEGKYEELVKSLKPKAERADTLEAALKGYYDAEIADIPEEKRALIPAGPVETQLSWVKTAKAQGIFTGGKTQDPPPNSTQRKTGDPNQPDFVTWKSDDPRLTNLSGTDYQRWKEFNGRGKAETGTMAAWGRPRS